MSDPGTGYYHLLHFVLLVKWSVEDIEALNLPVIGFLLLQNQQQWCLRDLQNRQIITLGKGKISNSITQNPHSFIALKFQAFQHNFVVAHW